jgi:hypothetical protein
MTASIDLRNILTFTKHAGIIMAFMALKRQAAIFPLPVVEARTPAKSLPLQGTTRPIL